MQKEQLLFGHLAFELGFQVGLWRLIGVSYRNSKQRDQSLLKPSVQAKLS